MFSQQVVFERTAKGPPVSGRERFPRCPDKGVDGL
jgi:hypothetical protein